MLHSEKLSIHAPSVIRLTEYKHIPFERRSLSRKNILLRDHSTCQYCGRQYAPAELTLDHVMPRSRGGESAWDNLVACCKRCNHRKGSRTPEESGMHLLRRPRGFRYTLTAKSCVIWGGPTKPGGNISSTNPTTASDANDPIRRRLVKKGNDD